MSAPATLRDQIMDELMDSPATITYLADVLGSYHERVRREMVKLEYEGLVYVSEKAGDKGRKSELFAMVRTRKAA